MILDQTIFYPQGGGSPYDTGIIKTESGIFRVDAVRFDSGIVYHIGDFEQGIIKENETVTLQIDKERRILNCKLQTAGHLIDEAVRNLGYTQLIPTKGYHFPDGPNVEYEGNLEGVNLDEFQVQLQNEVNKLVKHGFEVKAFFCPKDELEKFCYSVPSKIPEGKPVRVVIVWGEKGIPCGANHVKNICKIEEIMIRKIKVKGKEIKVGYDVQHINI